MSNPTKYTALTIGPIVDSLKMAHKTRELWAASFIFSWFIEKVIEKLMSDGVKEKDFIIPYPERNSDKKYDGIKKAGVFPDRLIIKSQNGAFDKVQNAVNATIKELGGKFKNIHCESDSIEYLEKYLRTYIVEAELRDSKNPIIKMNKYLANCELQSNYIPIDDMLFLRILENINNSDIYKKIFTGFGFPSIPEISTKDLELYKYNGRKKIFSDDKDDSDCWDEIINIANANGNEELKKRLKTAHKYIAIVQADGDNVGELIKEIYSEDKNKILEFSRALSEFSLQAATAINKWGGEPVYAGGDDLLFFAPVVNGTENIFTLIDKLDVIFKDMILKKFCKQIADLNKKPSMSYGVSITYYKYPMREALESAADLLFNQAKKTNKKKKNAIAFKLMKHSGRNFGAVLHKDSEFYVLLYKMLGAADKNLISSLIYNLGVQKKILVEIAGNKTRLDYFFENYYNEKVHKEGGKSDFIKKVNELLFLAFKEQENDIDKAINQVYSGLRLIKFINRELYG